MKVKKLGLSRKRGEIYVVHANGNVVENLKGKAKTVAKAKITELDDFLYFIDDDGDLAREFRSRRKSASYAARSSGTKPASAKLDARALFDTIETLLFPETLVNLSTSGFIEDPRANAAARKVYEKEFKRLAKEISYALGPPTEVKRSYGEPRLTWKLKGRRIQLTIECEDTDVPATINLAPYEP